uniref:Secreted protein n=1 Tax=Lygus hesperus TaxID=30085 RepID=A0A146LGA7_LYGHE
MFILLHLCIVAATALLTHTHHCHPHTASSCTTVSISICTLYHCHRFISPVVTAVTWHHTTTGKLCPRGPAHTSPSHQRTGVLYTTATVLAVMLVGAATAPYTTANTFK